MLPVTLFTDLPCSYFEGAISRIDYAVQSTGEETKNEINSICSAHIITLDVDDSKQFDYCSCEVSSDGKLRILFTPESMGTNIDYACQESNLFPALNNAPPADATADQKLSFVARNGIRQEWDAKIEEVRKRVADMSGKPDFVFDPNFDETFAKLAAASKEKNSSVRIDWQQNLGSFTRSYFEGLAWSMGNMQVGDDELVQEGFNDGVDKSKAVFRIVDKLKYDNYCEVEIEDGVLYLQSTASSWGSNADYCAQKLMERL
jgi:hypothetical protein